MARRRATDLLGILLLPFAVLTTPSGAGAEPLRLNTGVGAPYVQPDRRGFLDLLVPEVFRRLGLPAEAVAYPASERAMINANNGIDDGVAMRVKGLEKSYPNLVRVDEKVVDNDFVAYSARRDIRVTGFDALLPLQVGYITGWKVFEAGLLPGTPVTRVQDADQLFRLLGQGRVDVALFERWQGNHIVGELGLPVRALEPPLVSTEMFMYLHAKHAAWVGPAAAALRAIKADGTYRRIFDRSLRKAEAP